MRQKLAEAKASGKLDGLQEEFKRKVKEKVLRPSKQFRILKKLEKTEAGLIAQYTDKKLISKTQKVG